MVRPRRAALAGVQEGGQVLGLDLQKVLGQDSGRITQVLEHDPAQSRLAFHPQMDSKQLNPLQAEKLTERLQLVIGELKLYRYCDPIDDVLY